MCDPPETHIPHTRPCPETFSGLPRLEKLQLCEEEGLGLTSNTKWKPSPPSPSSIHPDRFCLPQDLGKLGWIWFDSLVWFNFPGLLIPDFGEWTMKETATAVGTVFSGIYSAFLGGMAVKLAIEGVRRSLFSSHTPSPDPEASDPGYDADQSSSASETGTTAKRVTNPRPRGRRRCPCPCHCPVKSKKDDRIHRRDEPKNYRPSKTTDL